MVFCTIGNCRTSIQSVFYVSTECVASGPLALVLRAARAVGAAPLRVTRAHAACLVAPAPRLAVVQRLFITACSMVLLAGLVWDFTQETSKRTTTESDMAFVVMLCNNLTMLLVADLTIYMGPSRMKCLIRVLKQLHQIKLKLEIKPPKATSETMRSIAIICVLIWSIVFQNIDAYWAMYDAFSENKMWPITCMNYTYFYFHTIGVVTVLEWHCAARGAHAAAAALNRRLRQLRQDVSLHTSQAEASIRCLALSYTGVSAVVTQLNAGYGAVLYAMITWVYLGLVTSPYYLQGLFTDGDTVLWEVLLEVNWSLLYTICIIAIVEPCHRTHVEMENTGHLLNLLTVYLAPKSERLSWELDRFAMQLRLDNAKFMPLGIYTLDRPLVATILGGVSTFLVILIQFRASYVL